MSPYHHCKCLREFCKLSKESDASLIKSWQIRNWQSTASGFLLDWRNELMASLTCARPSSGCTVLWAGVYQSILKPQPKGCCSKFKADEFGWQTKQQLFSSIFQILSYCLIIPDLISSCTSLLWRPETPSNSEGLSRMNWELPGLPHCKSP